MIFNSPQSIASQLRIPKAKVAKVLLSEKKTVEEEVVVWVEIDDGSVVGSRQRETVIGGGRRSCATGGRRIVEIGGEGNEIDAGV
ncbi:hypothetical protein L6452_42301 [Arctium lappa]|uniref:Uncharacterized protein n=1 Tax=Arctium lappa TaxID=4217 RepID=A0ACB8XIG9_ARCLA|nr:hypothetical protein L6452_42301 [Arctium lappa]